MTNYIKKTVSGAAFYFMFGVIASAINYLIRIYIARHFEVDEFGLFYSIFAFFTLFALFTDMGLNSGLVKFISQFQAEKKFSKVKSTIVYTFSTQFFFTIIFLGTVFVMREWLANNYFKSPFAMPILLMMIGWFFFTNIVGSIKVIFYGFQNFFYNALIPAAQSLLVLLLIVLFNNLGYGLYSLSLGWLVTVIILTLVFGLLLVKHHNFFKFKFEKNIPLYKDLWAFGLPMLMASIGWIVISKTDTLMLTYFRSLAEVGVYNVVLPTSLVLLGLSTSLSGIIFPISSELWSKHRGDYLRKGLLMLQKYSFMLILPAGLILVFFANLFLRFLFGPEYAVGALTMQIIVIGSLFYMIALINGFTLSGIGKPKIFSYITIFSAILNIILNLWLIPLYGILGAGIATTSSYLFAFFLSIWKISKHVKYVFPFIEFVKILFSGLVLIGFMTITKNILHLNPWIELFISVFIGGIFYILMVFFTRATSIDELKGLLAGYKK